MKNLFLNHKNQAFFLTLLFFLPLMLLLFTWVKVFQIPTSPQNTFSLAINQFLAQASQPKDWEQTEFVKESFIEPLAQKTHKKTPRKTKKSMKNISKESKPLITQDQSQTLPSAQKIHQEQGVVSFNMNDDNPVLRQMRKAIDSIQEYPRHARKMRMQGVVMLEFLWRENKTLDYVKVLKSSGYKILDESAVQRIYKASKLFPYYGRNLKITIPVAYSLT